MCHHDGSDSKRVRCIPSEEHSSFVIASVSLLTGMNAFAETVSLDVLIIVFAFDKGMVSNV